MGRRLYAEDRRRLDPELCLDRKYDAKKSVISNASIKLVVLSKSTCMCGNVLVGDDCLWDKQTLVNKGSSLVGTSAETNINGQ